MSLKVKINQTVLLGISDHYFRNMIQHPETSKRVIGALLGTQDGRNLSVVSSSELIYKIDPLTDEVLSIDMGYIKEKVELLKKVYSSYEFLGWYSCFTEKYKTIKPSDVKNHHAMTKYNENPIYLCLDMTKNMKLANELAMKVYETKLDVKEQSKDEILSEINYEIDVEKGETIAIDHVTKNYSSVESSQFSDHLSSLLSSFKILSSKLVGLLEILENNEKILENPCIMMELKEVLNSFPKKNNKVLDANMLEEGCETNLISFLSAIIGTSRLISEVKFLNPKIEEKFYLDKNTRMDLEF